MKQLIYLSKLRKLLKERVEKAENPEQQKKWKIRYNNADRQFITLLKEADHDTVKRFKELDS